MSSGVHLRIVERAVVVGVGGADVGERELAVASPPHGTTNTERRSLGTGIDRGDLVAHQRPRHGDVDALRGPDRRRGGVPSSSARTSSAHTPVAFTTVRARTSISSSSARTRAACTWPARVLLEPDERRVVRDGGAVVGGGLRDREREPGVVGLRVVVDVRRREAVDAAASACSASASSFETRLCSLPMRNPPVRSYIHIVAPRMRASLPGQQAVTGEHREEEGQHAHEVRARSCAGSGARPALRRRARLPSAAGSGSRRARASTTSTRCPTRSRRLLDERGAQPARRRVERDAGAGDAAADDEDVEVLVARRRSASARLKFMVPSGYRRSA